MRIDIGEQGSLSEILDGEPSCHKTLAWCDLRFASHICDTCFHVVFGLFFFSPSSFEFVLFCTALFRHDPIRFASPCLGVCSLPLLVFPICTAALMRLERKPAFFPCEIILFQFSLLLRPGWFFTFCSFLFCFCERYPQKPFLFSAQYISARCYFRRRRRRGPSYERFTKE